MLPCVDRYTLCNPSLVAKDPSLGCVGYVSQGAKVCWVERDACLAGQRKLKVETSKDGGQHVLVQLHKVMATIFNLEKCHTQLASLGRDVTAEKVRDWEQRWLEAGLSRELLDFVRSLQAAPCKDLKTFSRAMSAWEFELKHFDIGEERIIMGSEGVWDLRAAWSIQLTPGAELHEHSLWTQFEDEQKHLEEMDQNLRAQCNINGLKVEERKAELTMPADKVVRSKGLSGEAVKEVKSRKRLRDEAVTKVSSQTAD